MAAAIWCLVSIVATVAAATPPAPSVLTGASDASAAVALDDRHLVVADDEDNVLRLYDLAVPGAPIGEVDLADFLAGADDRRPEADLEGAARVGDRVYWIASHGRNRDGKERASRHVFFATDIVPAGGGALPALVAVGRPYRDLVRDLLLDPAHGSLGLERSLRLGRKLDKRQRRDLAPQREGFNIEGLAAGPEGSLLIGLRNPTLRDPASGRSLAIVLVLKNPDAVVIEGRSAEFAEPLLLDLDGLGIRSLEALTPASGGPRYLIVAGAANGRDRVALHAWDGGRDRPRPWPMARELPAGFNPEAAVQLPTTGALWLLSDDGLLPRTVASPSDCRPGELRRDGTCPNKFLSDRSRRTFRALELGADR